MKSILPNQPKTKRLKSSASAYKSTIQQDGTVLLTWGGWRGYRFSVGTMLLFIFLLAVCYFWLSIIVTRMFTDDGIWRPWNIVWMLIPILALIIRAETKHLAPRTKILVSKNQIKFGPKMQYIIHINEVKSLSASIGDGIFAQVNDQKVLISKSHPLEVLRDIKAVTGIT